MSPKLFPKSVFIISTTSTSTGGGGSASSVDIDSSWIIDWDDPSIGVQALVDALQVDMEDDPTIGISPAFTDAIINSSRPSVDIEALADSIALDSSGQTVGTSILGELASVYPALTVGISPTSNTLSPDYADHPQPGISASVDTLQMDSSGQSIGVASTDPVFQTSEILAVQDVWVPESQTLGDCDDTANHDQEDLKISGDVVGQDDARIFVEFPSSNFPSNATVTSGTLTLRQKDSPGENTASWGGLSTETEDWDETTVSCPDQPSGAGFAATDVASFGGSTGDKSWTLSTAGHDYMGERFGTTRGISFTLDHPGGANVSVHTFESKDEGTNDALGPRLDFTFKTPA